MDQTRFDAQMADGDLSAGMDHRFKPGGGREAESILERLRQRRQAAKAAKEDARDEDIERGEPSAAH
jgi:CPA2 family monovalent cation:H+ antiporter-2